MSPGIPNIILASGSPQRKKLLAQAGYRFDVIVPNDSAEDCGICSTGGPADLVTQLALRKAADVAGRIAGKHEGEQACMIVACDTVAECGGAVLGKPRDEDHARNMLQRLRGQQQRVLSGLCLWPLGVAGPFENPQTFLAVSELRMDAINDSDLEDYLASGLWSGKAGAFGYQDRPDWLHLLAGTETNVIGLPMELLAEQLAQFNINSG